MPAIRRLLIANRGEIALRILRTARALGMEAVVAHSAADAEGLAARLADGVFLLGPAAAAESYLSADRIVAAALETGCQAVHPGYGFLSEREELARKVEAAGLIYVGPTPENIRVLGDKLSARRTLSSAGIQVVPGETAPLADPQALLAAAARIGYPLMVKAAGGGGGRGIRLLRSPEELAAAFRLAFSEARSGFGETSLFAERYLERARHVEVQVVGDGQGGARVFPERDCSLQRRYQKLVEETPCPVLDASRREELLATAARIASLVRYRGAGTLEFLLSEEGRFYFLEANTRLQVEHPITEMVTGVDLVAEQLRVAQGGAYGPGSAKPAGFRGAAIELRINAEDPARGFRPSTGRIGAVRLPGGPGVRVDSALYPGLEVTPHYDPLIAKLIVWGETREEALSRLGAACREMWVAGVATTLPLAAPLLRDPVFRAGSYHCQHLERLLADPRFFAAPPGGAAAGPAGKEPLAVIAAYLRSRRESAAPGSRTELPAPAGQAGWLSPWAQIGRTLGLRDGERPSRYGTGAEEPRAAPGSSEGGRP
jgi:acetyl-CoA carboxylase biotin carboxylase subunit